jgi:maltose O-acetyltransferase
MPSEREKMLAGELYDSLDPELVAARNRARDLCQALNRIEIGADVWVGGAAIILPGVRIGSRAVIGAGSVVTRDVPEATFAAGNPCRVIRSIA